MTRIQVANDRAREADNAMARGDHATNKERAAAWAAQEKQLRKMIGGEK